MIVYLRKLLSISIAIFIWVYPSIYFDTFGLLLITWVPAIYVFDYLENLTTF